MCSYDYSVLPYKNRVCVCSLLLHNNEDNFIFFFIYFCPFIEIPCFLHAYVLHFTWEWIWVVFDIYIYHIIYKKGSRFGVFILSFQKNYSSAYEAIDRHEYNMHNFHFLKLGNLKKSLSWVKVLLNIKFFFRLTKHTHLYRHLVWWIMQLFVDKLNSHFNQSNGYYFFLCVIQFRETDSVNESKVAYKKL